MENDAYDKINMIYEGDGVTAYGVLYRWFTVVSGLGLPEQARMLMHPSPSKKEEELAEYVGMWQDKMRGLEAHGEEFKLAPLFKINSLRTLMTGKAKSTSIVGKRIATPPMRRRHTRSSSTKPRIMRGVGYNNKERLMQQGGDPMDVGTVGGRIWENYKQDGYAVRGQEDHEVHV